MLYQTPNPHGGGRCGRRVALDFSVNTNPLGTPERVRQAAADSLRHMDRYPDPCCRELTRAIARHERVPEDYILCGGGAAELIFSYCAALRPGRCLELAPTFSEYAAAAEAAGGEMERFPLRREGQFVLGEEFLDHLERGRWDAIFLCNPNNPTGQLIPPPLLEQIAQVCQRKGMGLFLDECFLDLSDGGEGDSLKKRLPKQPGLFILKAFTKSFGMAGLRLGYGLCGDSALLGAMSRTVQPWNVSLPSQAAGVAALDEGEFLQRSRDLIREERGRLRARLEDLGLWVCPSRANYLLLYSARPLFDALLDRGILVRSCANYCGLGEGWYRVAVKRREENRALAEALEEVLFDSFF